MRKFADARLRNNPTEAKKIINAGMRDLIAWWYDFVERHPDYTHTDDLQYPDQQSLAELQQAMADEAVRYTQPANNDELIALAAFVYAFKIGSKLVKYSDRYLSDEARKIVEKTFKEYSSVSKGSISDLVDGTINNVRWSDRIWSSMDALQSDVRAIMKQALLANDSPVTQTKYIRDKFKATYNQARRLLMTESARIMAEENIRAAEDAGYTRLKWVANTGACRICAPLDGKTYSLRDADGMQPRHPYCMCSWVPTDEKQ